MVVSSLRVNEFTRRIEDGGGRDAPVTEVIVDGTRIGDARLGVKN
jgi:hypothetical protein